MELDLFKEWLEKNTGLKGKSVRDVISRLKRVEKIIDLNLNATYEQILEELDKNEEFSNLTTYVKPQIKRAVKLYKKFVQENQLV
ncbi:hypothetical protein QFZ87_004802 [Bacillus sp. SLBN-46]|uniref:hypothetical protein n=1 Tax=Bacillus sp. SLBN-46 TaxID=3042283 RepID=UPI0028571DF6|nr:hypothetical protein [Bacillus sp. SLBN-46]MDR6125205.1 hypothetical protein [Bacillus sp. SLBN-46]